MAKVIKLTDNNNVTLLPVTDASYIQLSYDGITRSVKDVILENEEVTAAALTELNGRLNKCLTEVGDGLTKSGNMVTHTDTISAQTFGPQTGKTLAFGDTFTIPKLTINSTGHITSGQAITYILPDEPSHPIVHFDTIAEMNSNTNYEHGTIAIVENTNAPYMLINYCDMVQQICRIKWVKLETCINNYHDLEINIDTSNAKISYAISYHNEFGVNEMGTIQYTNVSKASTSAYGFAKYDSTPTSGSGNAVTSDGLYTKFSSYAPIASPTFSGTPTAPTATAGTNTTQIATTAFVTGAVSDASPFWVTISDDRGTLSCSHTYTQITEQITAGKKVLALYSPSANGYSQELVDDRPVVLNCVWTDQETILRFRASTGGMHDIIEFYMDANHPINVTHLNYSRTSHTHTNESMGQGYGTTTTGGNTAAKVVTLSNYALIKGGIVSIYFANAHTASSLSLNINSKGAKNAYYNNSTTTIGSGVINAGDIATFIYDGNYYRFLGVNSGFHNGYGACSTAAATTAKTANITNYKLKVGGIASIRFTYAVPASATLNINSTGAKAIYYNNAAITADVIKAGDTATFMYDGTYYRLISIDKTAPLDSPALTGTPTAPTAEAGTNTTQIATTAFVTTAVSNNTLKYTTKAVSSNAVSFTTSSKMLPNTVYVCGTVDANTNMITFGLVNSLSIANNSLDLDIGLVWNTRMASITNNMIVPTYQIVFRCGSSGASITLPSNVVWRDGSAPAASDLVNKWCELTIMNDIATIIII